MSAGLIIAGSLIFYGWQLGFYAFQNFLATRVVLVVAGVALLLWAARRRCH